MKNINFNIFIYYFFALTIVSSVALYYFNDDSLFTLCNVPIFSTKTPSQINQQKSL
jgi:hypothetical protein